MQQCYHSYCDDKDAVTDLNYDFLASVTQALVNAIVELAYDNGAKASSCQV